MTDWCRGGEWSRVAAFARDFFLALRKARVDVTVFLAGDAPGPVPSGARQERVAKALAHIAQKRTPPPKGMWVAPPGIRAAIRGILRSLAVPVRQSLHSHHVHHLLLLFPFFPLLPPA